MSAEQRSIFISYRRNASAYVAQAIFQHLRNHGYDVFMDVASINNGTFDTIILNQIAARAHFLIICTPGTFERCVTPGDWLRREIEMAMEQKRNIVPILANGFKFEDSLAFLTGRLVDLPRLHGLPLYHEYFDEGMARLRDRYLKQRVTGELAPTPAAEQAVVEEKIEQAAALPAPTVEELTAEGFLYRAYSRVAQGNLEAGIADYTQAIRLNPDYAEAYDNRANALARKGDLAGAIADYDQAIRIDPKDALTFASRGKARAALGNVAGAMSDLDAALRLNPGDSDAYYSRGLVHIRRGDLTGALADFNTALLLYPGFANAYDKRGEVYFALGRHIEAQADFEAALQCGPAPEPAQAGLALSDYALGRKDTALAGWRKLAAVNPHYLDLDWLGKAPGWRPELVDTARKLIAELNA